MIVWYTCSRKTISIIISSADKTDLLMKNKLVVGQFNKCYEENRLVINFTKAIAVQSNKNPSQVVVLMFLISAKTSENFKKAALEYSFGSSLKLAEQIDIVCKKCVSKLL